MLLEDDAKITAYICHDYLEVRAVSGKLKKSRGSIQRISKEEYVDINTGEVQKFAQTHESKTLQSVVADLFSAKRQIYENTLSCPKRCLYVTLTYYDIMQDIDKIGRDLSNYHGDIRLSTKHEYVDIIELGNQHTYHCHEILVFDKDTSEIDVQQIKNCWKGKGNVYITQVHNKQDIINIASYLTSYSSIIKPLDIQIDIWNYYPTDYTCFSADEQKQIKHYVKNKRLLEYPCYKRILRVSKGIKKP